MSINGMNGQFGTNIKKYQQMQGTKFGSALHGGYTPNLNLSSLNSSIFARGSNPNIFMASKQVRMARMGGYDPDAITKLNQLQAQQKTEQAQQNQGSQKSEGGLKGLIKSGKEIFDAGKFAFKAYDEAFGKGAKKTGDTEGKPSKAVDDIKNAEDKETLNNAIGNAQNEQKGVQAQEQKVNTEAKATGDNLTQHEQNAQKTQQALNQSTEQFNQNEQKLSDAKANVQTCTDNYAAAQTKTSNCKQALANAKAAATEDNPNTVAISKAEADLKAAEAEEEKAKADLEAAKQHETEAQQAVDKSKEQVQNDTKANTDAEQALTAAKQEAQTAKTEQQNVKQQSNDLIAGITEGEQKLEQMDTEPLSDENISGDVEGQNKLMDSEGYSAEEKAQVNSQNESTGIESSSSEELNQKTSSDTQDVKPFDKSVEQKNVDNQSGETKLDSKKDEVKPSDNTKVESNSVDDKKVDNKTETQKKEKSSALSERNGQYMIQGNIVNKEQYEIAKNMDTEVLDAGFAPTSRCEIETEDGNSKTFFVQNGKYTIDGQEVDSKTFLSEYNKATENSTSSDRIDIYSYCNENSDGTMTVPDGLGGADTIDTSGNVLKKTRKQGGVNNGKVTYDYQTKTKETDIDSMKGSRVTSMAVMDDMEKNGSEVRDKDGNVMLTCKDGEFYNAKGKKISASKAEDMINKNKGQGLKLVGKLKKSPAGAWV